MSNTTTQHNVEVTFSCGWGYVISAPWERWRRGVKIIDFNLFEVGGFASVTMFTLGRTYIPPAKEPTLNKEYWLHLQPQKRLYQSSYNLWYTNNQLLSKVKHTINDLIE